MLKPAILYKEEIERKFAEIMYTEDAYYYMGYSHANILPEIKPGEGYYQYAVLDGNEVVGFLSYYINNYNDSAERFGMISFKKGNLTLTFDAYWLIKDVIKKYRRVEWHCVGGNPVAKVYDKLCEKYNGYKSVHHKCTKDLNGNYRDSYTYEILNHGLGDLDKIAKKWSYS